MMTKSEDSMGLAMVCSADPETGECSADFFREGEFGCTDPLASAYGLRDSCAPDFPSRMWAVTGNDRARDIQTASRMRALGFDARETPESGG